MAFFTLDQIAQKCLRNVQIPVDTSVASVQALADAYLYINERAFDVWSRRVWREYLIYGSYMVPASTNLISLSNITPDVGYNTSGNGVNASFFEVVAIRNGSVPLLAEDPSILNNLQADILDSTSSPTRFVNLGQKGIRLLGQFQTPTLLNFLGKSRFQDLTMNETWIMSNDECLICGATGDFLRDHDRDDERAKIRYDEYESAIEKLIDAAENQAGKMNRVIPVLPWTNYINAEIIDISKTGLSFNSF